MCCGGTYRYKDHEEEREIKVMVRGGCKDGSGSFYRSTSCDGDRRHVGDNGGDGKVVRCEKRGIR